MIKTFFPESFDFRFDGALTSVVKHSHGHPERDFLIKRSAADIFNYSEITPKKDHTILHIIAMGDADVYGPNRNSDAFYKTARQLSGPGSSWDRMVQANGLTVSRSPQTWQDHTDVGNRERHTTFVTHGDVFEEHRHNKQAGDTVYGRVLQSAHNDPMSRVELLIEVPNQQWRNELEKLASGQDIGFSMASRVPYDICTYCLHKSATRKEYCPHMVESANALTKEGHNICVANDWMTFFDISRVQRPADRIATSLRKVASAEHIEALGDAGTGTQSQSLEQIFGNTLVRSPNRATRLQALRKCAAIEQATLREVSSGRSISAREIAASSLTRNINFEQFITKYAHSHGGEIVARSIESGVLLSPRELAMALFPGKLDAQYDSLHKSAFSPLLFQDALGSEPVIISLALDSEIGTPYAWDRTTFSQLVKSAVDGMAETRGGGQDFLGRVVNAPKGNYGVAGIITSMEDMSSTLTKFASTPGGIRRSALGAFGGVYAGYQISFVSAANGSVRPVQCVMSNIAGLLENPRN